MERLVFTSPKTLEAVSLLLLTEVKAKSRQDGHIHPAQSLLRCELKFRLYRKMLYSVPTGESMDLASELVRPRVFAQKMLCGETSDSGFCLRQGTISLSSEVNRLVASDPIPIPLSPLFFFLEAT